MAGSASAFDRVNWTWDKVVDERVTIRIRIENVLEPTGLVEMEKLQMYIGDMKAVAKVEGVHNNPPGTNGNGEVVIDETFDASIDFDVQDANNAPITGGVFAAQGTSGLEAELVLQPDNTFGNINGLGENAELDIRIFGTIPIEALGGIHDAADLPKIENAATAVGNNQSVESDVPIMLHDAQFYWGGFRDFRGAGQTEQQIAAMVFDLAGDAFEAVDDNLHTGIALGLTVLAMGGIVEKGEVEAKAKVSDILNAYVENAATAVVNNASFKIESDEPNNHSMIADLTQWAYADTKAIAKVEDVTINGYTGFGTACFGGGCGSVVAGDVTPIVSNVATAVGNNLNIKVGLPVTP
jgi:hypothetical protein